DAGVTVRPANCAGVKVQMPGAVSVPAERIAPSGTPEIVTDRLSDPSSSFKAAAISSAIALSSSPAASEVVMSGASASGATTTSTVAVVLAVSPFSPSVDVAVTVSWKSSALSAGGVTVKSARSDGSTAHTPGAVCVPAERLAPAGTPLIVTDRLSDP